MVGDTLYEVRELPDRLLVQRVRVGRHAGETDAVLDLPVRLAFLVVHHVVLVELRWAHAQAARDRVGRAVRGAVADGAVLNVQLRALLDVGVRLRERVGRLRRFARDGRLER